MAMTIQLKKINEDGYGEPFDFEIGTLKAPLTVNGTNYGEHSLFSVSGETRIEGGTDVSVLYGQPGDKWQAFDGDTKLGFVIQYVGQDGSSKEIFAIYNEEIQAGMLLKVYTSDRSRMVRLAINYPYAGATLSECIDNAKFLYSRHMEQFKEGFANNKNSFFVMMSYNGGTWYGNELINVEGAAAYPKMRYFSSVYKLITGEFYEKDKMFAMALNNGDKFYFGRVIEYTNRTVRDGRISDFASNVRDDPSYVFTDLVYGTAVGGYLQKKWSENVDFANGTRMAFANPVWNAGTYNKSFYPEFIKIGDDGNYKINWKIDNWGGWTGPDGKSGFNNIYLSKFQPLIEENTITSFGTSYDCQGVDVFMSPQYNEFDYKTFVDTLKEQTYTSDEWKKLLARVFTFTSTIRTKLSGELQTEYDYVTNNFTQVCFTGWAGFIERDTRICTNAVPNDRVLVNTFTSADKWGAVVKFVDPKDEEPGPGPGPEPEPEEDEEPPYTVADIAELSIKDGLPLLGDYMKLEKFDFMSDYLESFTDFDYDIMENRGFFYPITQKAKKKDTLEHFRQRSAFIIKKHETEIRGFKRIDDAEFSPIENYDRYELHKIKKRGDDTLTDTLDTVKSTTNYGEQKAKFNTGEQENIDTVGEKNATVENQHAGINSSDYQKNDKTIDHSDQHINKAKIGAREDNTTVNTHEDVNTVDEREDVHKQAYNSDVEEEMHAHGNIGITQPVQMLTGAEDWYKHWNFYNRLYDLILRELTIFKEDEEDVHY